jgi:hypothetical protein
MWTGDRPTWSSFRGLGAPMIYSSAGRGSAVAQMLDLPLRLTTQTRRETISRIRWGQISDGAAQRLTRSWAGRAPRSLRSGVESLVESAAPFGQSAWFVECVELSARCWSVPCGESSGVFVMSRSSVRVRQAAPPKPQVRGVI